MRHYKPRWWKNTYKLIIKAWFIFYLLTIYKIRWSNGGRKTANDLSLSLSLSPPPSSSLLVREGKGKAVPLQAWSSPKGSGK